jgi:nucleotide-binding universal stress UspA family protein
MFKKILIPLDGSELAAMILPQVVELSKTCKSEITLIHVCHTEAVGEVTPGVFEAMASAARKVCEAFLAKVGQELQGQGLAV